MDTLRTAADRLDRVAGELTTAAAALTAADLAPGTLGAAAPGRLGELGRELQAQWTAALDARAREAGAVADGLDDLAAAVRAAARSYADIDHATRRRHEEW